MAKKSIPEVLHDALNDPIEIGQKYGYSMSTSGTIRVVIGDALRFTPAGKVTLNNPKVRSFLYGEEHKHWAGSADTVSVFPCHLFPVNKKE